MGLEKGKVLCAWEREVRVQNTTDSVSCETYWNSLTLDVSMRTVFSRLPAVLLLLLLKAGNFMTS